MRSLELLEPRSVEEAAALLAQHGEEARLIAGGTAVTIMLKNRLIWPGYLVSLGRMEGLRYVRAAEDGSLRVGAMTTIREVELSPIVRERHPTLAHCFGKVANVRVRNAATVGGNLSEADYASDPPCMLLAAGARVKATSPRGVREIPLAEFFTGFYETALAADEVLTELVVPPSGPGTGSTYIKYVSRSSEDRPCAGVAAFVTLNAEGVCQDVRVAVGAVAETPQMNESAEAVARGQRVTEDLARAMADRYAEAIDPISDLRGSAWYRKEMVRVFVRDAILDAAAAARPAGRE